MNALKWIKGSFLESIEKEISNRFAHLQHSAATTVKWLIPALAVLGLWSWDALQPNVTVYKNQSI